MEDASGSFVSFDMTPFDFDHLLFGHRKSPRLILYFLLPQVCNQPFLYGTLLLPSGEWCLESQIWMLWGVRLHLSRVSGWMDTYISLCVCACIWELLFLFPIYLMFPFNIKDYYWLLIDVISVMWTVKWFLVTRTWLLIWFPCCKHILALELKSVWWEKGNMQVHNILVGGERELTVPPSSIGGS